MDFNIMPRFMTLETLVTNEAYEWKQYHRRRSSLASFFAYMLIYPFHLLFNQSLLFSLNLWRNVWDERVIITLDIRSRNSARFFTNYQQACVR